MNANDFDYLSRRFTSEPLNLSKPPPLCILIAAKLSNETLTLPETLRQFVPVDDGGRGVRLPEGTLVVVSINPEPQDGKERQCMERCATLGSKIPGAAYSEICIPDATCKTDNINGSLTEVARQHAELLPEIVCLMDADVEIV